MALARSMLEAHQPWHLMATPGRFLGGGVPGPCAVLGGGRGVVPSGFQVVRLPPPPRETWGRDGRSVMENGNRALVPACSGKVVVTLILPGLCFWS